MFDAVLIANRGEIACRIIRTCRRLGVRTVAVYSSADAHAAFVEQADDAFAIGGPEPRDSYLRIDRLVDAARRAGAQAIHPGFGFLAENAEFAEACVAAGFAFVGPDVPAIRAMASKSEARALMERAGVPVVPGWHGDATEGGELAGHAEAVGYPLMIKATAGGGGKGMRIVHRAEDFAAALDSARREAASAFGDDRVLLERYITEGRHVEIQVFGDRHGNVVHLFERDCSVQRRHQKVIEESPAPGLAPELRAKLASAAVAAARAVDYVGAGTVEFMLDAGGDFYFLEMNTRLQVEHPVTEMVTGYDLVEWQLRVAAGEPLPVAQAQIAQRGHAIEVRVYAEDPRNEFLPSIGELRHCRLPAQNAHVRVDTGVREGDRVDVYYDPMIAKLIVWDADRRSALRRLRRALADYRIAGVTTNLTFLSALAAHPAFREGRVHTAFIDAHRDELLPTTQPASNIVLALASLFVLLRREQAAAEAAAQSGDPWSPWHLTTGWRLNEHYEHTLRFWDWGREVAVMIRFVESGFVAHFGEESLAISGEFDASGDLLADLGGARMSATVVQNGHEITVITASSTHRLLLSDLLDVEVDSERGGERIVSPMPGRVQKVFVRAGDAVERGDALIVVEAMKMEHTVRSNASGVVREVFFAEGDQVHEDAVLVDLVAEANE
ncbi:MAG: acetyl-CoA carboxylase biotin carboxylase subunit [Deltaproteobacteria bacterium]|nr:acetyl-CoA carboxylase biotin carboxylase subunit [Deltaproteobacteria bacterium]